MKPSAEHPLLQALQAQAEALARADQDALERANRALEALVRAPVASPQAPTDPLATSQLAHQMAANRRLLARAQGQVQRGLEALQINTGTYDARAEVRHQGTAGKKRFTA